MNKLEFKVHDWVVFNGYCNAWDGKTLQIYKITSPDKYRFLYIDEKSGDNGMAKNARHATQEEIRKAGGLPVFDNYNMY